MPEADKLLQTIEAVYAAGLDAELWPQTLSSVTRLLGSSAATLETYDLPSGGILDFHAFGIPPAEEIAHREHYAAINPRAAYTLQRPASELAWDYLVLDEDAMDRDPYYTEFLTRTDFRYFLSGNLFRTPRELAIATIQRTRAQGHVGAAEIALMQRLLPHFRQALDMATRLKRAAGDDRSLKAALDWLADGVALIRADGAILYANDALQAIARRGDGFRIRKGAFVFPDSETRARFTAAAAAIARLRAGDVASAGATDHAVARGAGMLPYLLSMRPLLPAERNGEFDMRAVAIVFVRDPLSRNPTANEVLREVFGLTRAEADVARALQSGMSAAQYARERAVSFNTIYTHLRRIKEKTRCNRMGALIRKLNDLQVPLRID